MASKKKVTLTMNDRLKVLDDLQKFSVSIVAKKYNVHRATIARIKTNALQISKFMNKGQTQKERQRIKPPMYDGFEKCLFTWFTERQTHGDVISNAILMGKAMEMKKTMGLPDFKVSKGWLEGFKKRNEIQIAKVYRETVSADANAAVKFCCDFEKLLKESGIGDVNEENIYNMDETGLLWKTLPSKGLVHTQGKTINRFKIRKQRITVALCANATGTHKLKPLVTSRYESSNDLKDCKNDLPVIFKPQKTVWMTRNLFFDWYENYFKPSVREHQQNHGLSGKVVLLVDNCTEQRVPTELLNETEFKIIFFPPNTNSLIQPMDQGIIAKFKTLYRHKTIQKAAAYEGGINEFQVHFNLKECIEILHSSWMEVSRDIIINSWNKIIPESSTYHRAIRRDISNLTGTAFTEEDVTHFISDWDAQENRASSEDGEILRPANSTDNYQQRLEAQHIFHRLEQLVSYDSPIIRNMVTTLKNHILGVDLKIFKEENDTF